MRSTWHETEKYRNGALPIEDFNLDLFCSMEVSLIKHVIGGQTVDLNLAHSKLVSTPSVVYFAHLLVDDVARAVLNDERGTEGGCALPFEKFS